MTTNDNNSIGQEEVDGASLPPPTDPEGYQFPSHRLKQVMEDSSKTPLLLIACGSFSPVTYLHLRMFEMAADYVKFSTNFEMIGGYFSPVSDAYRKAGLASADHRIAMCKLAVDKTSDWLMVDLWEPRQKEYIPTALVLDHFDHYINNVMGGVDAGDGTRKHVRVALLAGADLIHTMSTPGVWSEKDLDHILGRYGVSSSTLFQCSTSSIYMHMLILIFFFLDIYSRTQWYGYR